MQLDAAKNAIRCCRIAETLCDFEKHSTPYSAQTWVKSNSEDPRLLVVLSLLASSEHCAKQGDEKASTAGLSNGFVKNPARLQDPDSIVYIEPDAGPDRQMCIAVAQFYRTSRNRVAERIFVYVHL